ETVIAMFLQTLRRCLYPLVLIGSVVLMAAAPAFGVVLWDTGSALTEGPSPAQRGAWRAVPSELFVFETDPLKAASDPGYYGRDYSFKGDAVVETEHLALVISPTSNRVLLYSKTHPLPPDGSAGEAGTLGAVIAEIAPVVGNAEAGRIRRVEVLSNIGDEVMLEVGYGVAGSPEVALDFSCGRDAIVAVRPRATVSRIRVRSPIEYGVIPAFIGDDLVLGPDDFGPGGDLCPPVEKAFLGLLRGEDCELLLTLPGDSSQPLVLRTAGRNGDGNDPRTLELEISGDGGFYLGAVTAPGVWHREPLAAAFLEKDVAIERKPPFAAR
ncbi:MAG: hypothetical protein KDM81_20785, partial [Verrucomicrobiae bacterium]|nr:hypothetical protein [Verrucomicrobiae bacterium]